MSAVEEVVIEGEYVPPEHALDVYRPFYTELARLRRDTSATVFDYGTKKGLEAARSYAYRLRKSRKPMKDAHDAAKVDHLAVIQRIDGQYRELDKTLDDIIEIVEGPIKEAEAREAERIEAHRRVMDFIASLATTEGFSIEDMQDRLASLRAVVIDESMEEFEVDARALREEAVNRLTARIGAAVALRQQEAELAALRTEKAERDRRYHEEKIAREAAETARVEAEAAAERGRIAAEAAALREREAAEARERAERARAERAEAEAAAAIESAARAQRETEERVQQAARHAEERVRIEAEEREAAARREREAREADIEHKRVVNNEVLADLIQFAGVSEQTGKMVIGALFSGRVRHIRIEY